MITMAILANCGSLHIEVLLKEYLRGLPEADAQLEKLEKAYNLEPAGGSGEE